MKKLVKVKNTSEGTIAFIDDTGKKIEIKPGAEIECKYKRSMDPRLVIIKKEVKPNGSNRK